MSTTPYQYQPHKPDTKRAKLIIMVALLTVVVLVTWAAFAKIDQVTRAKATVIASARTQEIQEHNRAGIQANTQAADLEHVWEEAQRRHRCRCVRSC